MYATPEILLKAAMVSAGILASVDYAIRFYYGVRDWQKRKRLTELDEQEKRFIRNNKELRYYANPLVILGNPFVVEARNIYNLVRHLEPPE